LSKYTKEYVEMDKACWRLQDPTHEFSSLLVWLYTLENSMCAELINNACIFGDMEQLANLGPFARALNIIL